jgi:hypothetical protein
VVGTTGVLGPRGRLGLARGAHGNPDSAAKGAEPVALRGAPVGLDREPRAVGRDIRG